jgi:Zn-ribbon-containing, possibly nucleic-acid-binding protein (DUF2310)
MSLPPDPHWKLRPQQPTPPEELCSCAEVHALVLQPHLTPNPLVCMTCRGEVDPARLGLTESIADHVAQWQAFHDAFYTLWLDSGAFENWARQQLEDPKSAVNVRGLKVASEVGAHCRCYYWWFRDTGVEGRAPLTRCPRCSGALQAVGAWEGCETCSIIVGRSSAV